MRLSKSSRPVSQAEITGVVIDGWGKGNPVKGQYTEIQCEHDGVTTDCWRGTLAITEGALEGRPAAVAH